MQASTLLRSNATQVCLRSAALHDPGPSPGSTLAKSDRTLYQNFKQQTTSQTSAPFHGPNSSTCHRHLNGAIGKCGGSGGFAAERCIQGQQPPLFNRSSVGKCNAPSHASWNRVVVGKAIVGKASVFQARLVSETPTARHSNPNQPFLPTNKPGLKLRNHSAVQVRKLLQPNHLTRVNRSLRIVTRARTTVEEAVDDPPSTSDGSFPYLELRDVSYQPPGCEKPILAGVNFALEQRSLGLIFGRSGSGKTTLLQILAGLAAPTSGSLHIYSALYGTRGPPLTVSDVSARTGLVFQFPERYFLADTVVDELLFGHVRQNLRTDMFERVASALNAVGMDHISMQTPPRALSDGYKRRLALAVQLIRQPDILLLDEPLAGLDWQARMDVVQLLDRLKKTTTLIVVSHDLRELAPLVDRAWRMQPGGRLEQAKWPLDASSQRLELGQSTAQ